ncbi:hypothetical protein HanRHA438_Chr04g0177351 [Helianthus annuus]|nr:hypothetical protein HanIR_Chr04g0180951 [Helianthus annuus]KAJ0796505.1 hypothetical protein HanPI659440_Chr04g0162981 [Helianthus annuus]KAJ0926964.1 hypothetical protein HanRHA438_Chr04g0177351 [Helianthus annuus]
MFFFVIDYAYQMCLSKVLLGFGLKTWLRSSEIEWQQYEICSSFKSLREAELFSVTYDMFSSCVMGDPYGASKVSGIVAFWTSEEQFMRSIVSYYDTT